MLQPIYQPLILTSWDILGPVVATQISFLLKKFDPWGGNGPISRITQTFRWVAKNHPTRKHGNFRTAIRILDGKHPPQGTPFFSKAERRRTSSVNSYIPLAKWWFRDDPILFCWCSAYCQCWGMVEQYRKFPETESMA